MKSEIETVGQRIKRIRNALGMDQEPFGKRLGFGQGTVSAWERDDKDRAPSAEAYFRLATIATRPEDRVFFLRQAGLSQGIILSAAERILAESIAPPIKGEIFRVPIVRRSPRGNEETGEFYPISAAQVEHPSSTVCLLVDEASATALVPSGTLIVLDTLDSDSADLRPFWRRIILLDIDAEHSHGRTSQIIWGSAWHHGLSIGRLRYEKAEDPALFIKPRHFLVWHAVFAVLTDSETLQRIKRTEMIVGEWHAEHPSAWCEAPTEEIAKLEKELGQEAPAQIRLEQRCRIVGRVIGWFPGPEAPVKK
jgi:transcriptional regulator with XRE-family HTH domain